ncbi:PLP-dependent aminotransferase family protein [Paenibacillus puldeungensis]|uniref:PLP-dependent aminotransferase family protein n=1 Tax=Paenibacillus puldeungensis TaxID=696536 RepID=A0ABW3RWE3_9BACL
MNELLIPLDRNASVPLYMQIYHKIKQEIIEGRLKPHTSLPSIRRLSEQLGVNKATLETAYDHLVMEGLIESLPRSGYYVQEIDTSYMRKKMPPHLPSSQHHASYPYGFHLDHVDIHHFPVATWRRLMNEVLNDHAFQILNTGDPQGERGLRVQIAEYVRRVRGVHCTAEQIVIGSHSQVLLLLLSNLLDLRGKRIAVGEPGYSAVTGLFESYGCKIETISLENDGFHRGELDHSKASIVFTSPSFQYPFGSLMKIQERIYLLKWACSHNAYIIEDDHLSEFRYAGDLIPSLQNLDREERVIYMGTFHGSLSPAINIGYMILPPHLLLAYNDSRNSFQQTTSRIEQKTLELFMERGHWEQHRFRMKEIYRKKYKAMVQAIQTCFQEKAEVWEGQTGLHLVMQVHSDESEQELLYKANQAGIHLVSFRETWYKKDKYPYTWPTFLLGFGGLTIEEIQTGIALLHESWF